jgi:EAL domain-containing protein (putative c-di-GMP-specific phosphodiesterase class I)
MNHPFPVLDPDLDCSLDAVEARLRQLPDGRTEGHFGSFRLASAFQPIVSVAHGRAVGYEALMRPRDRSGQPVAPPALLASARDFAERLFIDRLARAVHVDNALHAGIREHWLFLNAQPEVFVRSPRHGSFFGDLFASRGIDPSRVVIEVLEEAVADDARWKDAVAFYRAAGCLIALDDFGAGHSNFDRVWSVRPDMVKIDRNLVARAAREPSLQRAIPDIVSLLHEAGALVVMEGIETEEEAMLAMDADADFVQGYFFSRPAPDRADDAAVRACLDGLWTRFRTGLAPGLEAARKSIAPYQNAIGHACSLIEGGVATDHACQGFLELPDALRCYILDEAGVQLGPSLLPEGRAAQADTRFAPLRDGSGASWARRPYFRRAMAHPGRVQVSRPYLSLADARACVTLSMSLRGPDGTYVLCGDVLWSHASG